MFNLQVGLSLLKLDYLGYIILFLVKSNLDFSQKNILGIKYFIGFNRNRNEIQALAHFGNIKREIDWLKKNTNPL